MRTWAIAGGMLLATCMVAGAQETAPSTQTPSKGVTWFPFLGGGSDKAAAAKPVVPADLPPPIESPAMRRSREQAALQRRNEVIIQLRAIAQKTGDKQLEKQADDLQDRAFDLYLRRVDQINAELPVEAAKAPVASAKAANGSPSPAREDRR
jgi:hypothetical protein